jgi:ABC-type bacteriocin/lantibiotic exporter with double-glycine peptidase domain
MCAAYLDADVAEQTFAAACGTHPAGTSLERAVEGLRQLGFGGEIQDDVDISWLFDRLAGGEPVIVSLLTGMSGSRPVRHGVVVIGADGDVIRYLDPAEGRECVAPETEFLQAWELAGGGALVVFRQ